MSFCRGPLGTVPLSPPGLEEVWAERPRGERRNWSHSPPGWAQALAGLLRTTDTASRRNAPSVMESGEKEIVSLSHQDLVCFVMQWSLTKISAPPILAATADELQALMVAPPGWGPQGP